MDRIYYILKHYIIFYIIIFNLYFTIAIIKSERCCTPPLGGVHNETGENPIGQSPLRACIPPDGRIPTWIGLKLGTYVGRPVL